MSEFVKVTSDETFDTDVLQSTLPVIVDFTASWCGPCKSYAPTLEAVAAKLADQVAFYKIDIDDNMTIAQKFGVKSIPTTTLVVKGEAIDSKLGALTAGELEAFIASALNDNV